MKARNSKNESPSSKLVRLTFDDITNIDRLTGLQTTSIGADFIVLKWNAIPSAEGYVVQPILPQTYPRMPSLRSIEPNIKLSNLVPGVHINIKVRIFNNDNIVIHNHIKWIFIFRFRHI